MTSSTRTHRPVWFLVAGLLAGPAATSDAAEPSEMIREAVRAHGGEGGLGQWSNQIVEGDATFFFGTSELAGTSKIFVRDGRFVRREAMVSFGGSRREFLEAGTEKSAWRRFGSRVYDYPPDDHQTWLRHQPDILLRAAEAGADALRYEGRVDDEGESIDLIGFDGKSGTVRIGLDPDTRRVRLLSFKAMENAGEGKKEEVFIKKRYADYEEVGGVPYPRFVEEYKDGVKRFSLRVSSVELDREPDIALFARPEADEEAKEWFDQIAN